MWFKVSALSIAKLYSAIRQSQVNFRYYVLGDAATQVHRTPYIFAKRVNISKVAS